MTVAPDRVDRAGLAESGVDTQPARSRRLTGRFGVPLALAGFVAVLAQVPLLSNRAFYFWDDSAAQFIPTWRFIGEQVRAGSLPLLAPDWWAGGNLAAEALFGLFNPVCLGLAVIVSLIPNLAVAGALVKTVFLVVLALGGYALAREYGAHRWPAAAAGAALPFAGFTLYFDAGSWMSGLIATSLVPHLWWTVRRSARGQLTPIVPFVVGYLTITTGNPYGLLGACLVFGALLLEFGLARRWPAVRSVLLSGVVTGLCVPLVYLPLLLNSPVTTRAGGTFGNDGFMVPGLADVLNLSTPTFLPYFHAFAQPYLTVPVVYLAWWILPLLPWLDWRQVFGRARERAALFAFGAVALLLCVGPAYVWMFRWPARFLPFFALAAAVLAAVALSGGLRADRWRTRAAASGAIVAVGGYLAGAARPELAAQHVIGIVAVAAATAGAVWLGLRRPRWLAPLLAASGLVVLLAQTTWWPQNRNVTAYHFPTSVAELRADFADRYPGTVLQVASSEAIRARGEPETIWRHVLFGSMLHTAGVDSVNTYTGMNYIAFAEAICLKYEGSVICADALDRLFRPRAGGLPPLADLMKIDTLVVQNDPPYTPVTLPPGWRQAERTEIVTVYRRTDPAPWPGSRLSALTGTLTATPTGSTANAETLHVDGAGTLTFARLAWPGYTATLNDATLPVRATPEGLLQVDIPPNSRGDLRVHWSPPGLTLGILALAAAIPILLLHLVLHHRTRPAKRNPAEPGSASQR